MKKQLLTLLCLLAFAIPCWSQEYKEYYASGTDFKNAKFSKSGDEKTINEVSWKITSESTYFVSDGGSFSGTTIGSSKSPAKNTVISTSDIKGTINKIVVSFIKNGNSSAGTLSATVGGKEYTLEDPNTTWPLYTGNKSSFGFKGDASGEIRICADATNGGIRIVELSVYYTPGETTGPENQLGEITFSPAPDSDDIITITEGRSISISCPNATYIGYTNSDDLNDYGYERASSFTYTPTGDVTEFCVYAGDDTGGYKDATVMIIVEKPVVYDAYEYRLVTSASEITDDGNYVFVGGSNSAPYVSTTIEKLSDKYNTFISAIAEGVSVAEGELGKAGSVIKVVPSKNDYYAGANNMIFTKGNGKYSVKFSDDNMYLNTGNSDTECTKSATAESFTISVNNDNTLNFANSSNQIYFNSQSPRFKFYNSTSNQDELYLYKLTNTIVNKPSYTTEELEDYDNKEYIDGLFIYLEASEDCTIYATTNGDAPTAANNELEDDILIIESGDVDLRAIAVKPNGAKSEELNVSFKQFFPSDYSDTHIAYSAAEGVTPDMIRNAGSTGSTGRGTMLCIETEPEAKENAVDTYSTTYVLSSPDDANSRINAVKAARRADGKIYIEKNSTDHGHQEFYIGSDNNEGYYFWCVKEGKLLVLATEIGTPNLFLETIADATANGHEYICTFETADAAAKAPHRSISSNKETSPVTISFKGEKIAHGVDNGNYHFTSSSTGSSSIRLYAGENSNTTAIDSITSESDSNAGVEYYNLQGNRVAEPANGIYIRRQGNTAVKVAL